MMADNTAKMNLVQSTIGQLTALKKKISALDPHDPDYQAKYDKLSKTFDVLIPDLDVTPYVTK